MAKFINLCYPKNLFLNWKHLHSLRALAFSIKNDIIISLLPSLSFLQTHAISPYYLLEVTSWCAIKLKPTKYSNFFENLIVMQEEGAWSCSNLMCQILFAFHGILYPLGRVDGGWDGRKWGGKRKSGRELWIECKSNF